MILDRSLLVGALLAVFASPAVGQGLKPPTLLEGTVPDQQEIDLRTTPVVRAVQSAQDSVVSIYVHGDRGRGEALEGQGSGVIVDEAGYVITNWHVILLALSNPSTHRVEVRLRDERRFPATILSSSDKHDLALLQLILPAGEKVKPVDTGRSESLMIGETVIAIGNPSGHANTVTAGVLSATTRTIRVQTPDRKVREYGGLLQTDAAINQGNSGGALLDITGKLIGINNAMAPNVENIGFAIPVDTVRQVFEDILLNADNLATVWIGLGVKSDGDGVVVDRVEAQGPAARVGIQVGDRVLRVMDQPVEGAAGFTRAFARVPAGEELPILLERDGEELERRPRVLSSVERSLVRRLGLEIDAVTSEQDADLIRQATMAFYSGSGRRRVHALPVALRVRYVHPDSPAAEIGFQPGDVLLGTRVTEFFGSRNVPFASREALADRARQIGSGRGLFLLVLRDGETLEGEISVRQG